MKDQRLYFSEDAQRAFLEAFAPDGDTVPFASYENEWLSKWAHPVLHELWAHVGLGSFGRGYLHLIDPTQWHELLCGWVAGNEINPARIPFARTAFWRPDLLSKPD
jgi:GAD-like domain